MLSISLKISAVMNFQQNFAYFSLETQTHQPTYFDYSHDQIDMIVLI